jgi:hypothetical protein
VLSTAKSTYCRMVPLFSNHELGRTLQKVAVCSDALASHFLRTNPPQNSYFVPLRPSRYDAGMTGTGSRLSFAHNCPLASTEKLYQMLSMRAEGERSERENTFLHSHVKCYSVRFCVPQTELPRDTVSVFKSLFSPAQPCLCISSTDPES